MTLLLASRIDLARGQKNALTWSLQMAQTSCFKVFEHIMCALEPRNTSADLCWLMCSACFLGWISSYSLSFLLALMVGGFNLSNGSNSSGVVEQHTPKVFSDLLDVLSHQQAAIL